MDHAVISSADLQKARAADGRVVENLETQLGCSPEEFLLRLSLTLRMPAATLDEMRHEDPAFDALPYAEATRRSCVALRDAQGRLSVVLGDP
ncbi:MAG TPA: hypothetical protein VD838_19915, partial [Anaeromyxobacteraceae bacterium]|nr:hypothetical protein [Anaeromyxobacteraceae bacterium]